jgi:uncharacterized membrane protein
VALDAVSISGIALVVTIATFYLNHLRHKRALYLTFVSAPLAPFPDIALVNGSKSDLIVTSVSYIFHTSGTYIEYAQATEWSDRNSRSLSSGKGVHARITFKAPFDAAFVESGIYDRQEDCFRP